MFLSGYCGIVAELCLFTLAESLIGSTLSNLLYTMGIMMFFMGVGSWFMSKSFTSTWSYGGFIGLELALSLAVCTSVPSLTFLCGTFPAYSIHFFIISSAIIGFLIGMEIPLMQKLLQELTKQNIQVVAARIMMADYFGSLFGFALFSLILLYQIGIPWTAYSSGWLNGAMALLVILVHYGIKSPKGWALAFFYLSSMIWIGHDLDQTMFRAEQSLYRNPIILQKQTPYQKLTITSPSQGINPNYKKAQDHLKKVTQPVLGNHTTVKNNYEWRKLPNDHFAFYINGGMQFHSKDEYIYHEHLVHPAVILSRDPKKVLLMGAGDGLALRELSKYKMLDEITLIELDPGVVELFKTTPLLKKLNKNSFADPRLKIIYEDAWNWIRQCTDKFDVIILDFPDPHHIETAKLYSLQFYKLLKNCLQQNGALVTQSTSPLYSPKAFHCIKKTLATAGFNTVSLHVEMPSFSQWGFQLASLSLNENQIKEKVFNDFPPYKNLSNLDQEGLKASWLWPNRYWKDYSKIKANDFYNYALLHYYGTTK